MLNHVRISKAVLRIGLYILVFLIPIKFGMPCDSELVSMPHDLIQWIIYTWPHVIWQLLIVVLFTFWFVWNLSEGKIRIRYSGLDFLMFLFIVSAVISSIKAPNTYNAFVCLKTYCGYILFYFLALNIIDEEEDVRRLLYIFTASAVIISLYAIRQYHVGFQEMRAFAPECVTPEMLERLRDRLYSDRVFSTFIYPNTLAGYLLLCIPFVIGMLQKSGRGFSKFILILIIMCMLYALALTFYKGGIVFVGVVSVFIFTFLFIKNKRILLAISILTILLLLLILFSGYTASFFNEIRDTLIRRWRLWIAGVEMIKNSPIFGVGLGNFNVLYPAYKIDIAEEVYYAHNLYLQLFAEQGIIGIISFILLLAFIINRLFKKSTIFSGKKQDKISMWIFIGIVMFFVHNIFDFDWNVPGLTIIAFIAISLFVYKSGIYKERNFVVKKWWQKIISMAVVLILFESAIFYLGKNFIAEYYFRKAEKAFEDKNLILAEVLGRTSMRMNHYNPGIYFLLGNVSTENGDYAGSIEWYKKAILHDPYSSIFYYNSALSYIYLMHVGGDASLMRTAGEMFKKAVAYYPTSPRYRMELAQFYELSNERQLAVLEYSRCVELNDKIMQEYATGNKLLKHMFLDKNTVEEIRNRILKLS